MGNCAGKVKNVPTTAVVSEEAAVGMFNEPPVITDPAGFSKIAPFNPDLESITSLITRMENAAFSSGISDVYAMKDCFPYLIPRKCIPYYAVIPASLREDGNWVDFRNEVIKQFGACGKRDSRGPQSVCEESEIVHINAVTMRSNKKQADDEETEKGSREQEDKEIEEMDEKEENAEEEKKEDDTSGDEGNWMETDGKKGKEDEEEENSDEEGSERVFLSQFISDPLSTTKAYELMDSFIDGNYKVNSKPVMRPPAGALVFYDLDKLAESADNEGLDRTKLMRKMRLDGYRYNTTHSSHEKKCPSGVLFRHYYSVYNRAAPTKVDARFRRYEFIRDSYVMFHYIGDHNYARTVCKIAHGNSKDPSKMFVRANPSVIHKITEKIKQGSDPNKVYKALVNTDGDESEKPNNMKVVRNRAALLNRQKKTDQDLIANVFRLSTVLMYDDYEKRFVSYMEIISLRIHLFCAPAISELIRAFSIAKTTQHLEYDTQFSIAGQYLSNLIWRNPLLKGRPALTIGHFVHEFKNKVDHEQFIRDLLNQFPKLKDVRVLIGSDAEFDFTNIWPGSESVHCSLHWAKDVENFCYRHHIRFNCIERDLDELKFAESRAELLKRWDELKEERNYNAKLVDYMEKTSLTKFERYSSIWHLRRAGLIDPEKSYTSNTAESINALVARMNNDMDSIDVCVLNLFWHSVYQYNDTVRAWYGRGNWRLDVKFLHLKKDDSRMPKLMACPEPDKIKEFIRGECELLEDGEGMESKEVSNTPIIALAKSLIASNKVSVVQGGIILVDHNRQVFSVTQKHVRNKTSFLCACKSANCLHSIAAKIYMKTPVEDKCKLTLTGIKQSMKNPGDGKSGTKKGRAADKKVDKMIKRAEKRGIEKDQSEERKGRKRVKSEYEEEEEEEDSDDEEGEDDDMEDFEDEEIEEEMMEMNEVEEMEGKKVNGYEELENEEQWVDPMMEGMKWETSKRSRRVKNDMKKTKEEEELSRRDIAAVEDLEELFEVDDDDLRAGNLNITFSDLPRTPTGTSCGPKGVSKSIDGPKWLRDVIEKDPSMFNLESSLIYTPTFEYPLPKSNQFIIFQDKEGNYGAAIAQLGTDQVTVITPTSNHSALSYLSSFISDDPHSSKVEVIASQTTDNASSQLPLLLLLLHGTVKKVDLQTTSFPNLVVSRSVASFLKQFESRKTVTTMKIAKSRLSTQFIKYCHCRRPYPGKKLTQKLALMHDVPSETIDCSNCSVRWKTCIVGDIKKGKNGVLLCDICEPLPNVPKWGGDNGCVTNTCPIDGFLSSLIFAQQKNSSFHRNLPTEDSFTRACRTFVTGSDHVDTKKLAFIKAMFKPNSRGSYNLFGEEMDMVIEKAENACTMIVRSECSTCSVFDDTRKIKYIVKKREDQSWKNAFESTLYTPLRKFRCQKKTCGRRKLTVTAPDTTWMIPFDLSQMYDITPVAINQLPRNISIEGTDYALNAVSCFKGKPDGLSNHYSMVLLDRTNYVYYDGLGDPLIRRVNLDDIHSKKNPWKPKTAYYFRC